VRRVLRSFSRFIARSLPFGVPLSFPNHVGSESQVSRLVSPFPSPTLVRLSRVRGRDLLLSDSEIRRSRLCSPFLPALTRFFFFLPTNRPVPLHVAWGRVRPSRFWGQEPTALSPPARTVASHMPKTLQVMHEPPPAARRGSDPSTDIILFPFRSEFDAPKFRLFFLRLPPPPLVAAPPLSPRMRPSRPSRLLPKCLALFLPPEIA